MASLTDRLVRQAVARVAALASSSAGRGHVRVEDGPSGYVMTVSRAAWARALAHARHWTRETPPKSRTIAAEESYLYSVAYDWACRWLRDHEGQREVIDAWLAAPAEAQA